MSKTVTEEQVLAQVKKVHDYKLGNKTTCVVLELVNGFEVVGTSACVDPENYDHEVGVKYAHKRALDKVWELEGYRLQCAEPTPEGAPESEERTDHYRSALRFLF